MCMNGHDMLDKKLQVSEECVTYIYSTVVWKNVTLYFFFLKSRGSLWKGLIVQAGFKPNYDSQAILEFMILLLQHS